jgi:ABC-type multidrug transport system fused ATPase/permease subunit
MDKIRNILKTVSDFALPVILAWFTYTQIFQGSKAREYTQQAIVKIDSAKSAIQSVESEIKTIREHLHQSQALIERLQFRNRQAIKTNNDLNNNYTPMSRQTLNQTDSVMYQLNAIVELQNRSKNK